MVFVIKTNENSLFVRDIESGKEFDCLIKQGRTVEEKSVICVFGDKITAILGSVRFYTSSSYYDNYKFGSVEIKDDLVFLKELTGEQVEIMHTPKNLQPGQVIYVDEYYNFCGVYEHYDNFNKNIEPKNTVNIRPYKRKNKAEKIDIFKNVLILGNNSYEKSYKSGFLKFGYKADVLEGYEAWPKINSRIKDTDIIVIITDHISHNNMWRVKEYVTDIPVVYSEFNGVNRILQQIIDMEQKEYIPVDTNLI